MKPSCRIDEDEIDVSGLGCVNGVKGNSRRIRSFGWVKSDERAFISMVLVPVRLEFNSVKQAQKANPTPNER